MSAYLDTSALAKWYVDEARSEDFVRYLRTVEEPIVSSLTVVEMRSLLARRRRAGHLDSALERRVIAQLEEDLAQHHLLLRPVEDRHLLAAMRIMDRLPAHALRTLDAIHLAIAVEIPVEELATADRKLADAAAELGLRVVRFENSRRF